jgi:hypothetical protein
MRICALIVGLLLTASCAHDTQQSLPIDIDGRWEGQIEGFMGGPPTELIYNFKVVGDTLTGTVNGSPGEWIPLEDGKIKGNKISFTVNAEFPGGMKMIFDYKGKIKSDKIKLTYRNKTSGGFGGMGPPPAQSLTIQRAE